MQARSPRSLVLIAGSQRVPLVAGRTITIGRSAHCMLRLDDLGVASHHATVALEGDHIVARDECGRGIGLRGEQRTLHRVGDDAALTIGRELVLVARTSGDAYEWHGIVAAAPRSIDTLTHLARVAQARGAVCIGGESGSGKEGAARVIHRESARARGPFVALNCAALPESLAEAELFGAAKGAFTGAHRARLGAFQQAHGGTLLLDEIGELSPNVQAKLLRALESGSITPVGCDRSVQVDVRVVASTWRDLRAEADLGRFRHDLLHRLWVLRVELPPLRERPADIRALISHLLRTAGRPELMPGADLMALANRHDWPGNVRELKNCVERALAYGDPLELVPPEVLGARLPRRTGRHAPTFSAALIDSALRTHDNHRGRAARALGISRSTFYRWCRDSTHVAEKDAPGRVDTPIAPSMMHQASVRET